MRVCLWLLGLIAIAMPARAERFALDLGSGVSTASFTRPAGTSMEFAIYNRVPTMRYTVTIEVRPIEIPAFTKVPIGTFAGDPCQAVAEAVKAVESAKDEKAVRAAMPAIRAANASGSCANPAVALKARETQADVDLDLPGTYEIRAGDETIVTVKRDDLVWTYTFSAGPRGKWSTTFGAAVIPDLGHRWSLKGDATGSFTVTRGTSPSGPRVIPSVFFTWLSSARQRQNWDHGPTAGVGVDDKSPGIFAGYSATFNQNLSFIAGVALARHTRLRGQYAEGEVLKATLEADQLVENAYKPSWMVSITFRFGENPFSGGTAKTSGKSDGDK